MNKYYNLLTFKNVSNVWSDNVNTNVVSNVWSDNVNTNVASNVWSDNVNTNVVSNVWSDNVNTNVVTFGHHLCLKVCRNQAKLNLPVFCQIMQCFVS